MTENKTGAETARYAAFLRGINVGGHRKVPMPELKRAFEDSGFSDVHTILASGNVVFGSTEADTGTLETKIEQRLEEAFGFPVKTLVRDIGYIEEIVASDPFKGVEVTKSIRLFVTFLPRKTESRIKAPYESAEGSLKILKITDGAVFSVLDVSGPRWAAGMNTLEREFGKEVTTRNWNTLLKLVQ